MLIYVALAIGILFLFERIRNSVLWMCLRFLGYIYGREDNFTHRTHGEFDRNESNTHKSEQRSPERLRHGEHKIQAEDEGFYTMGERPEEGEHSENSEAFLLSQTINNLKKNLAYLRKYLIGEDQIVHRMLKAGHITSSQSSQYFGKQKGQDRINFLLENIVSKSSYTIIAFRQQLEQTNQVDLAKCLYPELEEKGDLQEEPKGVIIGTYEEIRKTMRKQKEVSAILYSGRAMTKRKKFDYDALSTDEERTSFLLEEVLMAGDKHTVEVFIGALRETSQDHLAEMLMTPQETVEIQISKIIKIREEVLKLDCAVVEHGRRHDFMEQNFRELQEIMHKLVAGNTQIEREVRNQLKEMTEMKTILDKQTYNGQQMQNAIDFLMAERKELEFSQQKENILHKSMQELSEQVKMYQQQMGELQKSQLRLRLTRAEEENQQLKRALLEGLQFHSRHSDFMASIVDQTIQENQGRDHEFHQTKTPYSEVSRQYDRLLAKINQGECDVPPCIFGVHAIKSKGIICIYVGKYKVDTGKNFAMSHFQCIPFEILEIDLPRYLTCYMCRRRDCPSQTGNHMNICKSWIGPGSEILAVESNMWNVIKGLKTVKNLKNVIDIYKEIQRSYVTIDHLLEKWTLGCHMLCNDNTHVILTAAHPFLNKAPGTSVTFLTQIFDGDDYKIEELSESSTAFLFLKNEIDVLRIEVCSELNVNLLQSKMKHPCNDEYGDFEPIFDEEPRVMTEVTKRGITTGNTYGKVIAADRLGIFLKTQTCGRSITKAVEAFAVSSTEDNEWVIRKFADQGDSGSLVLEKTSPNQQHRAYGIVSQAMAVYSEIPGEGVDFNAIVCVKIQKCMEHFDHNVNKS